MEAKEAIVEAKLENTVRAAIPQMIAEMPLEEDCENENGEDKREEIELALRKQRILKKPDEFSEEKDLNTCTSTNSVSSTIAMSGPPEVTLETYSSETVPVVLERDGSVLERDGSGLERDETSVRSSVESDAMDGFLTPSGQLRKIPRPPNAVPPVIRKPRGSSPLSSPKFAGSLQDFAQIRSLSPSLCSEDSPTEDFFMDESPRWIPMPPLQIPELLEIAPRGQADEDRTPISLRHPLRRTTSCCGYGCLSGESMFLESSVGDIEAPSLSGLFIVSPDRPSLTASSIGSIMESAQTEVLMSTTRATLEPEPREIEPREIVPSGSKAKAAPKPRAAPSLCAKRAAPKPLPPTPRELDPKPDEKKFVFEEEESRAKKLIAARRAAPPMRLKPLQDPQISPPLEPLDLPEPKMSIEDDSECVTVEALELSSRHAGPSVKLLSACGSVRPCSSPCPPSRGIRVNPPVAPPRTDLATSTQKRELKNAELLFLRELKNAEMQGGEDKQHTWPEVYDMWSLESRCSEYDMRSFSGPSESGMTGTAYGEDWNEFGSSGWQEPAVAGVGDMTRGAAEDSRPRP